MSYEDPLFSIGCFCADVDMSGYNALPPAGNNLPTYQFAPIWLGPAQNIVGHGVGGGALVPISYTANGTTYTQAGPPLGILQHNPRQAEAGHVVVCGITKAIAGGTWGMGDPIGWNTSGQLIKAATGKLAIATALESAVAGDISTIFLLPMRGVQ